MRKYSFSLMLSAALLASGNLFAADTGAESAMKTVLKLKKADGAVESLRFDGALAIGESRGYETDAGTPVLVTRTEDGLRIETAEKTINVALPGPDDDHRGIEANVEKRVRIEGHGEPAGETQVVVLRRHGDQPIDDAEIDALIDADLEALAEPEANGDGERQVVIVRKRVEQPAAQ
ncbi:MAG TPA: hypothetical protein PLB00_10120 [Pseudomonadota bacterium]|jgi:hypothetical protein|nr:hypothetical protein [Pseudomonadota bacterium]